MKSFLRLTGYEFRKICMQPIALILLVLFGIYGISTYYNVNMKNTPEEYQLYEHIGGSLTEENYNILKKYATADTQQPVASDGVGDNEWIPTEMVEVTEWGETYSKYVLESAFSRAENILKSEENRQRIMAQAQENIRKLENDPDQKYDYRYNQMIYRQYAGRGEQLMMNYYGWTNYLEFNSVMRPVNLFDLTAFLLCIFALCTVFARDYENGIIPILHTSYRGRSTLHFAKILAGVLFSALSLAILRILMIVTLMTNCDMSYVTAPVQSLGFYQNCPYNMSILQMIFFQYGVKLLFIVFLFLITILIGILAKRSIISLIGSFVGLAGMTALALRSDAGFYFEIITNQMPAPPDGQNYTSFWYENTMKIFNPAMVMRLNDYLEQYDYVNVLGFPVSRMALMISFMVLLIVVLLIVTHGIYIRQGGGMPHRWERKKGSTSEQPSAHTA